MLLQNRRRHDVADGAYRDVLAAFLQKYSDR